MPHPRAVYYPSICKIMLDLLTPHKMAAGGSCQHGTKNAPSDSHRQCFNANTYRAATAGICQNMQPNKKLPCMYMLAAGNTNTCPPYRTITVEVTPLRQSKVDKVLIRLLAISMTPSSIPVFLMHLYPSITGRHHSTGEKANATAKYSAARAATTASLSTRRSGLR